MKEVEKKQPNLKELLDFHEKFMLSLPKCNPISPQIVMSKNNEVTAIIILGGRKEIKDGIKLASVSKPDWIVVFSEGYTIKFDVKTEEGKRQAEDFLHTFRHGDLEKEFWKGNKNVIEVVTIQAYNKEGKLMRMIEKFSGEHMGEDVDTFDGYLTINDVDRVFW